MPKNSDMVVIRGQYQDVLDPDACINVQACKKSRNWNRYCTKEDKQAIVCNINEEHINAYWKIWDCVFLSPTLTMDHPYIVRNCRYTNTFKALHAEHWGQAEITKYMNIGSFNALLVQS